MNTPNKGHILTKLRVTYNLSLSQGVPNHKSYVVLFKYYGGGEVDYFEVAKNFGVQDSVAEPTSTGKKSTNLLTCPHIMYSQQFVFLTQACVYVYGIVIRHSYPMERSP